MANEAGSGTVSRPCIVKLAVGVLKISCSGKAAPFAASASGWMPVTSNEDTPPPEKIRVCPGVNWPSTEPFAETVNGSLKPVGKPVMPGG
jgi:hypothetical protein